MINMIGASLLGFDTNQIWWAISQGLYSVIDILQNVFMFIAGITPLSGSGTTPNSNLDVNKDLLQAVFEQSQVTKINLIFSFAF